MSSQRHLEKSRLNRASGIDPDHERREWGRAREEKKRRPGEREEPRECHGNSRTVLFPEWLQQSAGHEELQW